jgi:septum formation protein
MEIILASASPRRRDLLQKLGLSFKIVESGLDEKVEALDPVSMVRHLALLKARAVAGQYSSGLVIGADTLISFQGEILGKPVDEVDARRMLRTLAGNVHQVITGVAVVKVTSSREVVRSVATPVRMHRVIDTLIEEYVASGEPMDKAGAYAIQGKGGKLVAGIEGCYFNVVGFPMCEVSAILQSFSIRPRTTGPHCLMPGGSPCPRLGI